MKNGLFSSYEVIGAALMLLLVATIAVRHFSFAGYGWVVAVLIATLKAYLVAFYFMHLRWESPATKLLAASGVLWLILLIGGVLGDYLTRPIS